ncbi:MAG: zinc-dependent metalloprotease [Acidimicrobiia bacterium]|nr:zinc-dependent metalloprotease [Acidimicrobiia bacterium]
MSSNIFDQLMELINQPGPVNWKLAEQIAKHVTGAEEPIDPWLADEYIELTRVAQLRIGEASQLDLGPVVETIPLDRSRWAERNLRSFRYLIEPMADKMSDLPASSGLDAMFAPLVPALLGMQMGVMVGFLSHRVLGQFDIGLPSADAGDLYYVVPNIEAFASDNGIEPRQVRLWVALHEVTHQAQFAQAWVRPHFIGLIEAYLDGTQLDVSALGDRMQEFTDPSRLRELLSDPAGLTGMVTSPEQQPKLDAIQAFMAVIEGYSDYLMDRAAPGLLPDLDRMRTAMTARREDAGEGESVINRLLGMELKREQYRVGASFCEQVAARWGEDALGKLWEGPEHIPTLAELEDPLGWAARVLLDDLTDGL